MTALLLGYLPMVTVRDTKFPSSCETPGSLAYNRKVAVLPAAVAGT